MRYLHNYYDTILERDEVTFFVLSDDLKTIISSMSHPIAKRMIEDENKGEQKKITLIDTVPDDDSMWSYVTAPKVIQKFSEWQMLPIEKDDLRMLHVGMDSLRTKTRIGRVINKIYKHQYKSTDIESFINEYKKKVNVDRSLIDIVKGQDIKKWYDCKNYNTIKGAGATELHNSCMSPTELNHLMEFYAINPGHVSMVILYSDEDKQKIDARALLWKPDLINEKPNDRSDLLMDRTYYNLEAHKLALESYAEEMGWYYKTTKSDIPGTFYDPHMKEVIEGIWFVIKGINVPETHKFPFADTFAYYYPDSGIITNITSKKFGDVYGMLGSTHGEVDGLVWSDRYNKFVRSRDVVSAVGPNGVEDGVMLSDTEYLPFYGGFFLKDYLDAEPTVTGYRIADYLHNGDKAQPLTILKKDAAYSNRLHEWFPKGDTFAKLIPSGNLGRVRNPLYDEFIKKEEAK